MRAYSLNELFRLTRNELLTLHAEVVAEMVGEPEDSPKRRIGHDNLRSIRHALSQIWLEP